MTTVHMKLLQPSHTLKSPVSRRMLLTACQVLAMAIVALELISQCTCNTWPFVDPYSYALCALLLAVSLAFAVHVEHCVRLRGAVVAFRTAWDYVPLVWLFKLSSAVCLFIGAGVGAFKASVSRQVYLAAALCAHVVIDLVSHTFIEIYLKGIPLMHALYPGLLVSVFFSACDMAPDRREAVCWLIWLVYVLKEGAHPCNSIHFHASDQFFVTRHVVYISTFFSCLRLHSYARRWYFPHDNKAQPPLAESVNEAVQIVKCITNDVQCKRRKEQ